MKFGFSGLWSHVGSTLIAALLPVADSALAYFNAVELPNWAHVLVGVASFALAFYKGQQKPAPVLVPPAP